jgi:amino acid adenylation domain-containing protein
VHAADTDDPLTPAQQRLLFLHELDPDNPAYHIAIALELRGPVRLSALHTATTAVLHRHERLRARVSSGPNSPVLSGHHSPVWRVAAPGPVPLRLVDLGRCATGNDEIRDDEIRQLLTRGARRPFDLATGPLAEWTVLRLAVDHHVLLLRVHHIVFDAGSLAVLCRELESSYSLATSGRPDRRRPPGRAPGADQPATARVTADMGYWIDHLAGVAPQRRLWIDDVDQSTAEPTAVTMTTRLDCSKLNHIKAVGRARGATPFLVLAAALATTIARYTGQDDVLIGTPVAMDADQDRNRIDLMINILPLRLAVAPTASFATLLRCARDAALDALDHRHAPFERIVDALRVPRAIDTTPLFHVLLAYQRAPLPPRLAGLHVRPYPIPVPAAKYHLTVTATESIDALELAFEADARECDRAGLARFVDHLVTVLAAALADPTAAIARLRMRTDPQRAVLRRPSAARARTTEPDDDLDGGVHALVERVARCRPDMIAVSADDGQLTYRELDRHANRLARHLHALGAGADRVVGVHLRRDLRLVPTLLAVLKAGAAYLALDPSLPVERLQLMIAEAQLAVLITDAAPVHGGVDGNPSSGLGFAGPVVRLDAGGAVRAVAQGARVRRTTHPAQLAYLLYTSGSSGMPKAVAITHGNAVQFLHWAGMAFSAEELSATLATTSIGFDLSVFELFAPLVHGGTVLLVRTAADLSSAADTDRATLLNTVPSVAATLLDAGALPSGLAAINLAGEPLSQDLVGRLGELRRGLVIRNLYGPSEATTYAAGATVVAGRLPPIGTAVAGAELWLAYADGEPVPPGVAGEILIGGTALARGYLGGPGLTAAAFIPDHLGARAGQRLYRTGDIGRVGRDGDLRFLGRIDNQVKIRGVRIEPEEIEAWLLAHPAVREAAVVADDAGSMPRRLVAFVSGAPGDRLDCAELVDYLRARLPDAMVPGAYSVLDMLPRTANGKIDRRRLARQAGCATPVAVVGMTPGTVVPRSELERRIAEVWCATLSIPAVGVHDRFFDVGGNSLLMLSLVHRLRERVEPGLRLVDVFRCATVASLAAYLTGSRVQHATRGAARGAARRTARRRAVAPGVGHGDRP